jgi:hypothetical protein
MKNKFLLTITALLSSVFIFAQAPRITYTEPEREDSRRTEYEIIGKVGGNFVIYKNNRTTSDICVYDNEMKLKERVKMDYVQQDKLINIDFVAYSDYFYAFYQYQRRNVVYCTFAKIDANGKLMGTPVDLDTTHINFSASNKLYTTLNSDDKQRIMIFKINNRNQRTFIFTTLLFDNQLQLLKKDRFSIPMEERNDFFSEFLLTNEGDLVVSKFIRNTANSESILKAFLCTKYVDSSGFTVNDIGIGNKILDEIKLKIDNTGKRIIFSAYFYKQRKGNIEGLYILGWNKITNSKTRDTALVFSEELRAIAKGEDVNKKLAFNDYYIKNVISRKDGGFIMISEALYSSSRGSNYNRWDSYGYGNPWMSPMSSNYWSPYSSAWNMPWNRYNSLSATRYYADNIMVLSFSKDGVLEWSNVIPKSQFDDDNDNNISFSVMNTGGDVHFLFNQVERRTSMLSDQSIGPDGKISRNPTLRNLDKGYEFMPRLGKQVSSRQMIVPCLYRNYLCFSKIDF